MAILTRSRLNSLTEQKLGTVLFSRTITDAKAETKSAAAVTVFLSHSHDDLDNIDINRVVVLLRRSGVRVYVDSLDSSLPPFTSDATANKIKSEIQANKKFILVATNRAILSRWCNWELGYGDAYKYLKDIAIIPLADSSNSWTGNEYLKIYPRIEESENLPEVIKVIFPTGNSLSLSDWLLS